MSKSEKKSVLLSCCYRNIISIWAINSIIDSIFPFIWKNVTYSMMTHLITLEKMLSILGSQ